MAGSHVVEQRQLAQISVPPQDSDLRPWVTRLTAPVTDAGDQDLARGRFLRETNQAGADEVPLLLGLAVVEDAAEDDAIGVPPAALHSGACTARVVIASRLRVLGGPLASIGDGEVCVGLRR